MLLRSCAGTAICERRRKQNRNGKENHGGTEGTEGCRQKMKHEDITKRIIGSAIEVHKHLGPGLLESIYERCLDYEFSLSGLKSERQKQVLVYYKDLELDADLRADFVVENKVVVELKAVDAVHDVHRAQVLTYMRLAGCNVGLLINFNVEKLTKGTERFVL